jgi:hypothetical protein
VDHPCAEMYSGGWSAGFSNQGREGPNGGGIVARGPAGVASTLKTAGAFLFLLPGGRPRRDEEGAATAAGAVFFPLPFGRPSFRFPRRTAPLGAPIDGGATGDEAAAAAFAARASRVLLLRLPFGRPRPRGAEGTASGASTTSLTPSGALSSLTGEWPEDDMAEPSSRREGSSTKEKRQALWAVSTLGI